MKTCLSNYDFDGKRPRGKELQAHLERFLQNYLHIYFDENGDPANNPLLATAILVQNFASAVGTAGGFHVELGKLLGSQPIPATATELVEDLADVFCHSVEGIEADLLKKSLQEAFLLSIDVRGDATVVQFRDLLRKFLRRHGAIGLNRLFIGLHMFNTIWLELLESDTFSANSEEALDRLSTDLEKACFAKIDKAIAAGLFAPTENARKLS